MHKIDLMGEIERLECTMRRLQDPQERRPLVFILQRWQHDEMLDPASRQKAGQLVEEFRVLQPLKSLRIASRR